MDLEGVVEVVSGYTGGHMPDPAYEQVCSGTTGHTEAVQITFDSRRISFKELLDIFWRNIDPTDPEGQFFDRGGQYRTGIFYHNEEQRRIAEESKEELEISGRFSDPIATEITPASAFYKAEEYHQGYCKLNPLHYKRYRAGSGRDEFLESAWKEKKK